jgi:hypothetical protein
VFPDVALDVPPFDVFNVPPFDVFNVPPFDVFNVPPFDVFNVPPSVNAVSTFDESPPLFFVSEGLEVPPLSSPALTC